MVRAAPTPSALSGARQRRALARTTSGPSSGPTGGLGGRRKDFPILSRLSHGRPLAYLDSAATSQKPLPVIEAEEDYYRRLNANVHRGVYELSEEATEAYEAARARVARFLGSKDPEEVVFVRGTTEALNLAASSLARSKLAKGDRIVSTEMEHHSNIVPWHLLRGSHGTRLEFVGLDDEGRLLASDLDRLVTRGTRVFTFTHVSNVLGTVNPVAELADRAHAAGALAVLDAAQSAPHRPLRVEELGVDLLAFSGHKVLGPTGIGVLWGRKELLRQLAPYMGGGEMIVEVGKEEVTYKEPPYRFEAGTPNIAGAIVLGRALEYLEGIGWDELAEYDHGLVAHAYQRLREALGDDVKIFGPPPGPGKEGVLSFSLKGAHPHDIATLLDAEGIAVRAGHHCAQLVMKRYAVPALTRASYYFYNTREETERLVAALVKVRSLLCR